jgi:sulfide:quinone oxidoreductase
MPKGATWIPQKIAYLAADWWRMQGVLSGIHVVLVLPTPAVMAGREPSATYDGYASCPLTTARNRMVLAEFDYTMKPHPTFPLINMQKERYDMWLLKRYGLPFLYWNLMLKGRA